MAGDAGSPSSEDPRNSTSKAGQDYQCRERSGSWAERWVIVRILSGPQLQIK